MTFLSVNVDDVSVTTEYTASGSMNVNANGDLDDETITNEIVSALVEQLGCILFIFLLSFVTLFQCNYSFLSSYLYYT